MRDLQTQRLSLKRFVLADALDLFTIRGDPAAMAHWDWPGDTDIEQTRAVAQLCVDDIKREQSSYWTVRTRPGDVFVGVVDLSDQANSRADVGFMIKRELWGQGYASEALGVMIDEAWTMGLALLTARAHADNDRSTRLLNRLGFRETAVRPVEIRPGVSRECRFFELRRPQGRDTCV
jgi:RimJ/RimL family protein N-acetyltransferase